MKKYLFKLSAYFLFFVILILQSPELCICQEVQEPSLAIMDFEMSGKNDKAEDWAAGLSDFTLAMLQEKGFAIYERRDLQYVFSEYRLQNQGLSKPGDIIRGKLPWVKHLITGTVNKTDNTNFTMSISLLDMSNGTEAARFNGKGIYPDDLCPCIISIVDQISEKLSNYKMTVKTRKKIPGFTNTPEIALLYYQGLDYFMKGYPEYAEYYFSKASLLDNNFFIARVWQMKAFEKLKLGDFAKTIYKNLINNKISFENLATLMTTKTQRGNQILVNVVPPFNRSLQNEELENILRSVISERTDIQLFSPAMIPTIATELDIELSGSFNEHVLKEQDWLTSDAFFSASYTSEKDNTSGKLTLQLIDSFSGNILAQADKKSSPKNWKMDCNELVSKLLEERVKGNEPGDITGYTLSPEMKKPTSEGKVFDNNIDSINVQSSRLRAFSEDPYNKDKLIKYYEVKWEDFIYHYKETWPFLELLHERLLTLVDVNEPEAPYWLFYILWHRFYNGFPSLWMYEDHGVNRKETSGTKFEILFSDLIKRYPESIPSLFARYISGIDKLNCGNLQEAYPYLQDAANSISGNKELNKLINPKEYQTIYEIQANIFYFTARTAKDLGKTDDAKKYSQKALEALNNCIDFMKKDPLYIKPIVRPLICSVIRSEDNKWVLYTEPLPLIDLAPLEGFKEEIKNLHADLSGGQQLEMSLDQLTDRINDYKLPVIDRYSGALAYIKKITKEVENKNSLYLHFYSVMNNIRTMMKIIPQGKQDEAFDAQKKMIIAFKRIYDKMPSQYSKEAEYNRIKYPIDAEFKDKTSGTEFDNLMITLYKITGMYDESNELAEILLSSPNSFRRSKGVVTKAWVLNETGSPQAVTSFLENELVRFEKDFPDARIDHYMQIIFWCADAYEKRGQFEKASEIYEHGIRSVYAQDIVGKKSRCEFEDHYRLSLMFHQARVEEKSGDILKSLNLLKSILKEIDGCSTVNLDEMQGEEIKQAFGYIDNRTLGMNSDISEAALNYIERLRK